MMCFIFLLRGVPFGGPDGSLSGLLLDSGFRFVSGPPAVGVGGLYGMGAEGPCYGVAPPIYSPINSPFPPH